MSFEVVTGGIEQKSLRALARANVRVRAGVELKTHAKKILSATSNCFLSAIEKGESEVRINGRVVTRVIYVDEFDAFNSEERTDVFSEKVVVKGFDLNGEVSVTASLLETVCAELRQPQTVVSSPEGQSTLLSTIDVESLIELNLMGLVGGEIKFASDIRGNVEARHERAQVATFARMIETGFSVDEAIEIDRHCSGVLGVDVGAFVRDIDCNDGRVIVKGVVTANVIGVKTTEFSAIYNTGYEFDFNQTLNLADISFEDTVLGNVAVSGVTIKANNRGEKNELMLNVDLMFSGSVVKTMEVEFVADAFGFDNVLSMTTGGAQHTVCLPQANVVADVENNVVMPNSSPFISKVLSVNGARISGLTVAGGEEKAVVEGFLTASVMYECEERFIHTHEVVAPFNAVSKVDGLGLGHSVSANAKVLSCGIKARRGKELLIDARLGLNLTATSVTNVQVTTDVVLGELKQRDDSAITIYIVNERETLWDVAKRINISRDEITRQNPFVADGLKVGDKLYIYRQAVVNF